jgi:hypothetical protein
MLGEQTAGIATLRGQGEMKDIIIEIANTSILRRDTFIKIKTSMRMFPLRATCSRNEKASRSNSPFK